MVCKKYLLSQMKLPVFQILWLTPGVGDGHNSSGNVSFTAEWQTVNNVLGPNLYLLDQIVKADRIQSRILLTKSKYDGVFRKLSSSEYSLKSLILESDDNEFYYCLSRKLSGGCQVLHDISIAVEADEDECEWLYNMSKVFCNDHFYINIPATERRKRKDGRLQRYKLFKCHKYNTLSNTLCPYQGLKSDVQEKLMARCPDLLVNLLEDIDFTQYNTTFSEILRRESVKEDSPQTPTVTPTKERRVNELDDEVFCEDLPKKGNKTYAAGGIRNMDNVVELSCNLSPVNCINTEKIMNRSTTLKSPGKSCSSDSDLIPSRSENTYDQNLQDTEDSTYTNTLEQLENDNSYFTESYLGCGNLQRDKLPRRLSEEEMKRPFFQHLEQSAVSGAASKCTCGGVNAAFQQFKFMSDKSKEDSCKKFNDVFVPNNVRPGSFSNIAVGKPVNLNMFHNDLAEKIKSPDNTKVNVAHEYEKLGVRNAARMNSPHPSPGISISALYRKSKSSPTNKSATNLNQNMSVSSQIKISNSRPYKNTQSMSVKTNSKSTKAVKEDTQSLQPKKSATKRRVPSSTLYKSTYSSAIKSRRPEKVPELKQKIEEEEYRYMTNNSYYKLSAYPSLL